jgi:predicted RNA binding protein YcfA (HicA-like mRNA interferase family)
MNWMTQRERLLSKIRNNPYDVTFADLTAVLEGLGFPLVRTRGSHHFFRVGKRTVIVPRHGAKVKAYVVQQALDALDEFYGTDSSS